MCCTYTVCIFHCRNRWIVERRKRGIRTWIGSPREKSFKIIINCEIKKRVLWMIWVLEPYMNSINVDIFFLKDTKKVSGFNK